MDSYDLVVTGGGLAGLTLARQLRIEAPHVRLLVAEKRSHPVPEATFKVGESSVEIGAHYYRNVLGLDPHLFDGHLPKLGIRYFFPHEKNRDLTRRVEIGPPELPLVPSFQLDRGRFENTLLVELRQSDIEVMDGCSVRQITLGPEMHEVHLDGRDGSRVVRSRWLVDASGRAGLIRRQLGLTRTVGHRCNACWFRVSTRVKVDDWGEDLRWRARVPNGSRWLSTNHLMGRGYWVWLIPLGSGSTSIGVVADATLHPFGRLNRFDRALEWLRQHEPQCAAIVAAHEDRLEDFLALRHYAYGCERVFSPDRWALVGEAGLFTDPFYSPGSDFIAIGNECAADLVSRAARGEDVAARAEAFNTTYLRLFDAFLRVYEGQYPLFGNAQVMTAKAAWDNGCYWAVPGLLYFQRRYRDVEFIGSLDPLMRRFFVLHARMQQFFRAWDLADPYRYEDHFADVAMLHFLKTMQDGLAAPRMQDEELRTVMNANLACLEAFARTWQALAIRNCPELPRFVAGEGDLVDLGPLELRPTPVSMPQTA